MNTEPRCIHKTHEGYCELHSDGIEYREPCVEGPCSDEEFEKMESQKMERLTTDTEKIFIREAATLMSVSKDDLRRHYNDLFDRLQEVEVKIDSGELVPVVHGKWVNLGFIGDKEMVGCPVCHGVSETRSDFCKDCGAKMNRERRTE